MVEAVAEVAEVDSVAAAAAVVTVLGAEAVVEDAAASVAAVVVETLIKDHPNKSFHSATSTILARTI